MRSLRCCCAFARLASNSTGETLSQRSAARRLAENADTMTSCPLFLLRLTLHVDQVVDDFEEAVVIGRAAASLRGHHRGAGIVLTIDRHGRGELHAVRAA